MNLTTKEKTALLAIAQNGLEGMGGDEPKDLFQDNYSWFDRQELTERTKMSQHEASGIMSALDKKGLIAMHDPADGMWALTEAGIETAHLLWSERKDKNNFSAPRG